MYELGGVQASVLMYTEDVRVCKCVCVCVCVCSRESICANLYYVLVSAVVCVTT
jgi:hypothetical protein